VLEEAIAKQVNLIVSYHPAIFKGLKQLTQVEWKQRSIVKCIEQGIAVYSPHTSWDNCDHGINDWILEAFNTKKIEQIETTTSDKHVCGYERNVKFIVPKESKEKVINAIGLLEGVKFISSKELEHDPTDIELEFIGTKTGITELLTVLKEKAKLNVFDTLRIYDMEKPILRKVGLGRKAQLSEPIKIHDVIDKMKRHLNMKTFRVAIGNGKTMDSEVKSVAIGAGCGVKLLGNLDVDFLVTGEYMHHDILHEVHRGVSLIVTDHTNTERGYFKSFKANFEKMLEKNGEKCEIILSEIDRDPLEYI